MLESTQQIGRSITLVRRGPRQSGARPTLRAVDEAKLEPVAGNSAEQQRAEQTMLELLGRDLGVALEKRRLVLC